MLVGFLVAMLHERATTQVVVDKDRGLEILVRAMGGHYLPLRSGVATGFNPLQLPDEPRHVEFLRTWLRLLIRMGSDEERGGLSSQEEADLDLALRGTLQLERPERRLSRLVEFLDPTDPSGAHARLATWCGSQGGESAWLFDNPADGLATSLSANRLIGIDVTDFLENPRARIPITFYLFHLIRELLDGRPFACWMDEFGRLLADPVFQKFAQEAPNGWRKMNAVMCGATQSASDVLASPHQSDDRGTNADQNFLSQCRRER